MNENIDSVDDIIQFVNTIYRQSYFSTDIINNIFDSIIKSDMEDLTKALIIKELSDSEYNIIKGRDELIEILNMFINIKKIIKSI